MSNISITTLGAMARGVEEGVAYSRKSTLPQAAQGVLHAGSYSQQAPSIAKERKGKGNDEANPAQASSGAAPTGAKPTRQVATSSTKLLESTTPQAKAEAITEAMELMELVELEEEASKLEAELAVKKKKLTQRLEEEERRRAKEEIARRKAAAQARIEAAKAQQDALQAEEEKLEAREEAGRNMIATSTAGEEGAADEETARRLAEEEVTRPHTPELRPQEALHDCQRQGAGGTPAYAVNIFKERKLESGGAIGNSPLGQPRRSAGLPTQGGTWKLGGTTPERHSGTSPGRQSYGGATYGAYQEHRRLRPSTSESDRGPQDPLCSNKAWWRPAAAREASRPT